jgi:hypothetical protein
MTQVECPCGKMWEIDKATGKGYEEFRQHLREEDRLLTPEQWTEAAHRIEKAREKGPKFDNAAGVKGR